MNSKVTPSTGSTNTEQSATNCWQRLWRLLCCNNAIAPAPQPKEHTRILRPKQYIAKTKRVSPKFSSIESIEPNITVPPTQLIRPQHHRPPSAQPNPIRKNGLSSTLETSNKSAFALHQQSSIPRETTRQKENDAAYITHLRLNN